MTQKCGLGINENFFIYRTQKSRGIPITGQVWSRSSNTVTRTSAFSTSFFRFAWDSRWCRDGGQEAQTTTSHVVVQHSNGSSGSDILKMPISDLNTVAREWNMLNGVSHDLILEDKQGSILLKQVLRLGMGKLPRVKFGCCFTRKKKRRKKCDIIKQYVHDNMVDTYHQS